MALTFSTSPSISFSLCSSPLSSSSSFSQHTDWTAASQIIRLSSTTGRIRRLASLQVTAATSTQKKKKKKKEVLIVNTNSGGHALIGFWLAKELKSAGHEVTIFTVGEEASDKMKKPPFSRFSELREIGIQTVWGNQNAISDIVGSVSYNVILDNNGKDLNAVKPVADWAKAKAVQQFLFISSAGIYKTTDEPPHIEEDAVKEDAGHVGVEKYIAGLNFSSWASFRPQYITGSGNNKDCEEWFFDQDQKNWSEKVKVFTAFCKQIRTVLRDEKGEGIVRGRPVPIPAPGLQLTNIAHVRDLSSMLALAVENPHAVNSTIFNAVSDRAITFDGLVRLCAKAARTEAKIVHYHPKALGIDAKKAFPFRNMVGVTKQHFYAEPRAAKEKLGWKSATHLGEDLKERFQEYVESGRDKEDLKFDIDDRILGSLKGSNDGVS